MRLKFVSKNQTYFQYRQKINELYNFILEIQLKLGNQSKAIIIVNNITDLYQNGELIINDQVKPVIITSNLLFENYITQYADSLLKIVDVNFKFTLNDSNIFYNYIGMKANIAISKHNYNDAMKSLILISENYKIISQKDRIELGFTYSRIGGLYANVGDLDSSLYYTNKSNQIYFEDNAHFNNYRKLIVYNYLEMCTKNLLHSNYEAADSLINILSDKKYNDDIQYDRNIQTKFLLTKGNVCLKINKLEQLNEIITEIKSNLQNDSKLKQSYYPNYLELFANYALKMKNWIEAKEALINLENIYTTSNDIYGLMNVYIKQNNIYFEDKDFELMKNNFDKGKNLVQEIAKLKEYDHNTYMELSYFLSSLGYSIYFGDTCYANSMIRIIDNYKIITDYPEFLESYYYDLMLFYVLIDNPNYFKNYYHKELSLTIEKINKLIAFYPINEQSKILNIENLKRNDLKYFLIKNKLYEELYNDQLHFKSFTLKNNSILRKEIGKLNDDTLTKKYKTLRDDNVNLLKLFSSNNVVKISEIQKRIEKNYKYLKANCIKCNDLQNKVDINYLAIQSMLLNDNAAIEFIRYYDKEVEVYKYNALVIKKKGKLPISVYLCKESELLEYFSTKSLSLLYDLVWEPIDSLLQGVETVYYSPDGILYSVPFHALCMDDTSGCNYLMDKYNLHQVSTTRYLADSTLINTKPLNNTIALYGGINYDAVNDTSSINHEESNEDFILANTLKRETTFSAVSYLPGTKQEVESVVPLFNKNKWNTTIATGSQASEQLFKSYSDTLAPSIIHIATHGFAFPVKEESKKKNRMDMLMLTNNQQQYTAAEDPMMRCGLMFAGANKSWTGNQKGMIEQTGQDGILTAAEVANMDLSNTKLVVLSACETGLGKVEGSEGVFGLQRGFKLAGVEQLIVSLWKVPDRETMELMNLFYTDLTITKDPVISFSKAQKQMRNNYPDNPEKWAGFVLVR
jgi:CHAT domain-containing protein